MFPVSPWCAVFMFAGKEWQGEGCEFELLIEHFTPAVIPKEWLQGVDSAHKPVTVTGARRQGQRGWDKKGQLYLDVSWLGIATMRPHPKAAGSKRHLEEALISVPRGDKIHVGIQKVPSPSPSKQFPSNCHNFGSQGIFAKGPAFYIVALLCSRCSKCALIIFK